MRTKLLVLLGFFAALSQGCDQSTKHDASKQEPMIMIVGDDDDVGSSVYVDDKYVTKVESAFLSPIRAYAAVQPGRRVVEVKKNGVTRNKKTFDVKPDSGIFGMLASKRPGDPPD